MTAAHQFLFYCLFNGIEVNLPDLMCRLIEQCHKYLNRILPYAAQLTLVFSRFTSPSLVGAKGQYIMQFGVYNRSFIMKFMRYNIQDNEVFRSRPRDSSSSEDDDEEEEEDNEEAPPADDAPLEVDDHDEGPHPEPMDTTFADRGRAATFSMEFESRMDQRMDHVKSQLQSMQADFRHLTLDIAQFNLNSERMCFQVEHQSKRLTVIWTVFNQQPPPPPE